MLYCRVSFSALLLLHLVLPLPSYRIDLDDQNVFEVASDYADYDELSENEMIQQADLVGFESLAKEESRYEPLHSVVEDYNRRAAENKMQLSSAFTFLQPIIWDSPSIEEKNEPFIAGFKEDLNKKIKTRSIPLKSCRVKRDNDEYPLITSSKKDTDFFQIKMPDAFPTGAASGNLDDTTQDQQSLGKTAFKSDKEYGEQFLTPWAHEFTADDARSSDGYREDTESPGEDIYDYEKFKMEYYAGIVKDIDTNKTLNYTAKEESEESPEVALKQLLDLKSKNCTEVSKLFGIKAIDCVIHHYQHGKNKVAVKKNLSKLWLMVKIWFLIYVCLAIPLWCHKGWCCCCFRCKFCFPRKRILFAKQYYAMNSPGTLATPFRKKEETQEFITYEPTEFEQDAYEQLGAAIRNI